MEENKTEDIKKQEEKKTEAAEAPKEEKKEEKKKTYIGVKKTEAIVNGKNLSIGRKHAVAICNFIRGKDIDVAIKELEDVASMKRAIPMKGEIPHKKGMKKASGSGRYPVKGAKIYIALLKSLKSNAIVNELELEKCKIYSMPNRASRPYKRFGQGRMKRSNVMLKLIPRLNARMEK